jgi:5'-nucleotidase
VCSGSGIDIGRRLAAMGPGRPDVYVMGHAHVNLALDFDGMPAVEPTSSGRAIAVVDVPVGGGPARTEIRAVRGEVTDGAEPAVDSIVTVAVERVRPRLEQPVATIAEPLRRGTPQNPVGNLLADAMRAAAGADVGMWNNGGVRADIAAGPLNYGGVHYVTPFGNLVTRVRLRGSVLLQLLEATVDGGRPDAHVSGLTVEFDPAQPRGRRVVRAVDTAGRPVDRDRIYVVAMNDFMVENDFREQVAGAIATEFLTVRDIDAVSEFLRRQPQPVRGDATARIRAITSGSN